MTRNMRIGGGVALALIVIAGILVIASLMSSGNANSGTATSATSTSSTPSAVRTFSNPPTARSIADSLNCKRFRGGKVPSASPMYGIMYEDGVCYIGSKKYGLNTFTTKAARNSWLKMATPLGVNPEWETDKSVVYPSTSATS